MRTILNTKFGKLLISAECREKMLHLSRLGTQLAVFSFKNTHSIRNRAKIVFNAWITDNCIWKFEVIERGKHVKEITPLRGVTMVLISTVSWKLYWELPNRSLSLKLFFHSCIWDQLLKLIKVERSFLKSFIFCKCLQKVKTNRYFNIRQLYALEGAVCDKVPELAIGHTLVHV